MVNKFLYPNGGSETYIFKIGKALEKMGHTVEFFGMDDPRNIVGNSENSYTKNMDFRGGGGKLAKLFYPLEIIYSADARRKIAKVLDSFKPDAVHLNNINFQITPSIIYEIKKRNIKIIWTVHDYMLVCPNHQMYIPDCGKICSACTGGKYVNCFKNKCLHGSAAKSAIAAAEGYFYKMLHTYRAVDCVICPSAFIKDKLGTNRDIHGKCRVMHNFIEDVEPRQNRTGDYVLYFGRFDREKGIETLIRVCRELPDIKFVFAGGGELEDKLRGIENIENVGFKSGAELEELIRGARFSVYPSEWYENCPFSVMESQMYGVPVVGADIGGIPELIRDGVDGKLFESGNAESLKTAISALYRDKARNAEFAEKCKEKKFDTVDEYCAKLIEIYSEQ